MEKRGIKVVRAFTPEGRNESTDSREPYATLTYGRTIIELDLTVFQSLKVDSVHCTAEAKQAIEQMFSQMCFDSENEKQSIRELWLKKIEQYPIATNIEWANSWLDDSAEPKTIGEFESWILNQPEEFCVTCKRHIEYRDFGVEAVNDDQVLIWLEC